MSAVMVARTKQRVPGVGREYKARPTRFADGHVQGLCESLLANELKGADPEVRGQLQKAMQHREPIPIDIKTAFGLTERCGQYQKFLARRNRS